MGIVYDIVDILSLIANETENNLFIISRHFFSNLLPIDRMFLDGSYYRYSNKDGSVTFTEFKARDFEMMKRKFESYSQKTGNTDTIMYRLFKRNPLTFWRWGKYFISKRYKLPYKDWSEIKAIRGEIDNKTGFQDF